MVSKTHIERCDNLSHHEFVGNHTQCEVVHSECVVLSAHHLWSYHNKKSMRTHIARRATRVVRVLTLLYARDAHVRDPDIALLIQHQILWLDVTLNDVVVVQVLQANENAGNEEFYQLID